VTIDADDRDVLRYPQPGPAQRTHGAEGDLVGVRVHGRGRLAQAEQFAHGFGTVRDTPVHGGDEAGIGGDASLPQSRVVGCPRPETAGQPGWSGSTAAIMAMRRWPRKIR
jgi:hypothetical protein